MMGFVIATVVVTAFVVLMWLLVKTIEGSLLAGAAAICMVIVVLGVAINAVMKDNEKGPCHQYETELMYNPTTKTMMPSRVCVLRGEWVEEDHDKQ